jgi:hypothetical protein
MSFAIEWPKGCRRYPQRWWHRAIGWCLDQDFASRFPTHEDAESERKRAMLGRETTRVVEVPTSPRTAKIEIEALMGELVDLLAVHLDASIDPRAWSQLLIYAPK